MKNALFFIALLPPPEIREEVTRFKKYSAEHFNSGHALKSPPHITLVPPFRLRMDRLKQMKAALMVFAGRQNKFYLQLNRFDAFPPRVIFVDVEENDALFLLQKQLSDYLEEHMDIKKKEGGFPFHPHMTVAFKDLKKGVFPLAWDYYSALEYQRFFEVSQITLLIHEERRWEVHTEFSFSG